MIAVRLPRRREARLARLDRGRLSSDVFVAGHGGDLDRADDPALPGGDRRAWRDLVDEIDRRQPLPSKRGDTATRMLFRGLDL